MPSKFQKRRMGQQPDKIRELSKASVKKNLRMSSLASELGQGERWYAGTCQPAVAKAAGFNGRMTSLEVHMSDLSSNSQQWWEATMEVVSTWYAHHMTFTPIQRLSHVPELPDHLKQKKWSRLEKRAASLLMASIPENLREEVVASKAVSANGIICWCISRGLGGARSHPTST